MKRNTQLINLILCLIALIFVLSCSWFSNFNSSSDTPANAANTTDKTVNNSAEFESISATDLYNAYKKDQAAGDQKFKGKTIMVTGEISLATEKSLTGEPVAAFKVDGKDGVSGKFIDSQKAAVGKLKEGQTATFKCQVKGALIINGFSGVLLQDCEVAPPSDSSAVKQSTPGSIDVPAPPSPLATPRTTNSPGGDTPKTISGGVLNGKATSLPKPGYPPAAKAIHASGTVTVQVTVDETGKVVSAKAVSGHPLLQASAVQAAYAARFAPQILAGKAVKVTGVITYNFQPE